MVKLEGKTTMIRHTILFKIKQSTSIESVENALKDFIELKNQLPGILEIIAGECQFHDDKSTHFFNDSVSHGISIDFQDKVAYERFFKDPITHPAKNGIVNIVEGGYEGLVGFDFLN